MSDSRFYANAVKMINSETEKMNRFCEALDQNPTEKKKRIVEYKRAKYRYAGATNVWCMFFHSYRVKDRNAHTHYLIPQVNEVFELNAEYVALYDNAPEEEKLDYGLYYGVKAFAEAEIAKLEEKLPCATDWEKIELEERIGGLRFAKECLDVAWQKRKDVSE